MDGKTTLLVSTVLTGLVVATSVLAADGHACHACAANEIEVGFSVGYVRLDEDRARHEEDEHEGEWESKYSTHLEATYVFNVGAWHLGPVVDYSWTDHGEHFTTGIHFGVHL